VVEGVLRFHAAGPPSGGLSRVGVGLDAGIVAAGDIDPEAVARGEQVAGGAQVEVDLLGLARLEAADAADAVG